MIKNYFKIAVRNLLKYKIYSSINIFGLSIGIACFLIMILFMQFFTSIDHFHENQDRIHLIYRQCFKAGRLENRANIGTALAPLVKEQVSGIENIIRFSFFDGILFSKEKRTKENFIFTDAAFFDVFTFPLLKGDPEVALKEPFTVVITPEMSQKYFGNEDPVNQVISIKTGYTNKKYDFKITGVLKKIPENSHMHFTWLASYQTLYQIMHSDYLYHHWDSGTLTYIELANNVDPKNIEAQLAEIADRHVDKESYDQLKLKTLPFNQLFFRPFHLSGYLFGGSGSLKMIMILMSVLATAILLIACFNYINLSTAKSITRTKEVGLRKIVGSNRKQILLQFLGESILFSLIALILAIGLVELVLPFFNQLTGIKLAVDYGNNYSFLFAMMGICLLVGVFAGSYPAFVVASFKPVSIFSNQTGFKSPARLRKIFVVFQFVITTIFIIVFLAVQKQIHFIQTRDLGFDKEHVIVLPVHDKKMIQKYDLIKHELLLDQHILQITGSSQKPGTWSSPNRIIMSTKSSEELNFYIVYTDYDYMTTLGVDLQKGRTFNPEIASDCQAILMNESAYKIIQEAVEVGEHVALGWKSQGQFKKLWDANIIGVLEDFHFRNLLMKIQPVIFKYSPDRIQYLFLRVNGAGIKNALNHIDKTIRMFAPDQPMEYTFLDEDIAADYQFVWTFEKVMVTFLILALSIACSGLFGLALFIIERRTKEIGIRKVLGASLLTIFTEQCFSFLKLIVVANLIAWPLAYLIVNNLILQEFYYRTEITGWLFLVSGLAGLIIALATISWQAIRAATANPVESLRCE